MLTLQHSALSTQHSALSTQVQVLSFTPYSSLLTPHSLLLTPHPSPLTPHSLLHLQAGEPTDDMARFDHAGQMLQNSLDLVRLIEELDHDRQIQRHIEQFG